ncbi:SRPBCC family protein [Parapedobacter tibetensis]|nr:SRPBCC family protein [Parapedobacter tibetensis]
MPVIELKTNIQAPIEVCFDLARSIDLHELSTGNTRERAVAGVTTGLIGLGETVTFEATHFGVRQRLTSVIAAFERPRHFRDEMVKGAFRYIRHDHFFEGKNGVTVMTDQFDFGSPLGVLGRLANWLVLTNYLRNFIDQRNMMIKQYAESDKWKEVLPALS